MSDNLGITRLPQGATTPEVMVNAALSEIDAFLSDSVEIDLSAGNITLTVEALKAGNFVSLNGAAEARTVLLPQTKRTLFVRNNGTAEVSLTRGSTTVAVPAGEARTLRLTGAVDGLYALGGGGGGGSGPGLPTGGADGQYLAKDGPEDGAVEWRDLPPSGGGGIAEAPINGKSYLRKDAAWSEVLAGPITQKLITTEVIAGNSGTAEALAGVSSYFVHGSLQLYPSLVWIGAGKKGKFKKLKVVTQDAPGAGQFYKFTLQNLFSDTPLTCTISGSGSNESSDNVNEAVFEAIDRWSIKIEVSSGANPPKGILFGMEFETEQDITIPSVIVAGGGAVYPVSPPTPTEYPIEVVSTGVTGSIKASAGNCSFLREDLGASNSDKNFMRLKNVSNTTQFTFDALFLQQNQNRYGYQRMGIILGEESTNKYSAFYHASESNSPVLARLSFTGAEGSNASFAQLAVLDSGTFGDIMLRIKITATQLEYYYSHDYGLNFFPLGSVSKNPFWTVGPDRVGFILQTYNTVGKKPLMNIPYAKLTIN